MTVLPIRAQQAPVGSMHHTPLPPWAPRKLLHEAGWHRDLAKRPGSGGLGMVPSHRQGGYPSTCEPK